ncbi:DDE_3 domain-containing protein [Trichonephila clavipes]|nr:DDE_3 domain-containing protein [Trichonephila clavipes]
MDSVDFLHHENPPIWAGVKPKFLGVQGENKTHFHLQWIPVSNGKQRNPSVIRETLNETADNPRHHAVSAFKLETGHNFLAGHVNSLKVIPSKNYGLKRENSLMQHFSNGPFLNGLVGAIFLQDNAHPHTARVAQDFLHFKTLPWRARSPDLSPVEHVWDQLKRQMPSYHSVHDLELAVQNL